MFTIFNVPVVNLNIGDQVEAKLQGADNRRAQRTLLHQDYLSRIPNVS